MDVLAPRILSRSFVPVVLTAEGRRGSFFTSELTLTNRGSTTAAIYYDYSASFGGGAGTAVDSLEPGRQRVIPDAIAYLKSLGVPIGSGSAGGTLAVQVFNLSTASDAAATVRVTTPVEEGSGRAGLAFPGLPPDGLLTGPCLHHRLATEQPGSLQRGGSERGERRSGESHPEDHGLQRRPRRLRGVARSCRIRPCLREGSISTTASWTWPASTTAM